MIQDNKNIVVDLDNTLLDFRFPYIGVPIEGSVEAINTLTTMGYKIAVYSCRNNPKLFSSDESMKQNLKDTEAALRNYGFKGLAMDKGDTGKPCALYYVDDSGIEFNGWEKLLSKYKFSEGIAISIGIENCILDKDVSGIHKNKRLKPGDKILDFMGSTELIANLFRISQTEEKLKKDYIPAARQIEYGILCSRDNCLVF